MTQIEFIYNSYKINIQCQSDDKISNSIEKFLSKFNKKKEEIVFIYNGDKLDEELSFKEIANNLDKARNLMKVLVTDNLSEEEKKTSLKKSKYIICPECQENARISIKDFQISIYDCKNGHVTNNIQLNEFEKTQYINETKIICGVCKAKNKNESTNNKFCLCSTCKLNLCLLCQTIHDKSHYIIDYDDKDFYCQIHSDVYNCFCLDCQKDLCALCENQHSGHKLINHGSIMPDKDACQKELENLDLTIKSLKKNIKEIVTKLNLLNDSLDNYFEIYSNMVKNFDMRKRNYSSLQNINDIKQYNNFFMQKITEIINDNNIKTKFNELLDLFNQMSFNEEKKNEENKINENKETGKESETEEGNNNEKKEKNDESNEDTIEDKNYYDNIKRYNPSDNKYENFQISKMNEIKSFEVKYDIQKIIILHDRRVLTIQSYRNEKGDTFYKIIVYDLNNGIICDINYDIVTNGDRWGKSIEILYQMNDDNIIMIFGDEIKIYKIKRKTLKEIDSAKINYDDFYILTNEKLLSKDYDWNSEKNIFYVYLYENGKLNKQNEFSKKEENIENICGINENEIVIYYYKEGFFGSTFLLFYDIKNCKDIKTIKMGKYDSGREMLLLNDNNLIVDFNEKLVLIDTKKRVLKKEYKIRIRYLLFSLNDNTFLERSRSFIQQFKLVNSGIKLIEEKEIHNKFIGKYPDDQLIIIDGNKIYIYGQSEAKDKIEIHQGIMCDGCEVEPIRGTRYKCKKCKNLDYCQDCYIKNKISHGHEFKIIHVKSE